MSHFVGSLVQAPSSPLVIVSTPLPLPEVLIQPMPWCSTGQPSGSGPTRSGSSAPWHLPNVWPPTMSADGLLVVHRHAGEGLADVPGGGERVGVAVRALRVHVDEAHLHGAEGTGELAVAAVALVAEPRVLGAPEDLLGLPDVLAPEAEAERLEPHRLQGDVAGEDEQVGPRDLLAVLLLDRPEQPARLVEVGVVGPAVERGEALHAAAATAAAVGDAVRAGGVPRHPDEERPVVAVVGRPPLLRRRHHVDEVLLERVDVEGLELLRVVEVRVHRVAPRRVLVEDRQVELVGPPVLVRPRPARLGRRGGDCWVLAFAALSVTSVLLLCRGFLLMAHCFCFCCRCALGAPAPVDDLGLVDLVARVVGGRQARRVADRAVDVDHPAAGPADEVVVVVTDPVLVAGRRTGGLDAPEEALVGEGREGVVHRLPGDGTDRRPARPCRCRRPCCAAARSPPAGRPGAGP